VICRHKGTIFRWFAIAKQVGERPAAERNAADGCSGLQRANLGDDALFAQAKYDDGGFSGGHTDRPALQRLLEDVGSGKIDVRRRAILVPDGMSPQHARPIRSENRATLASMDPFRKTCV
jgi:hypothetical protein